MARSEWGVDGPDIKWGDVSAISVGERRDIVCQLACFDKGSSDGLVVLYPSNISARITSLGSLLQETISVTIFDAVCIREEHLLTFAVDEQSKVVQHSVVQWSHFSSMLELCCGLGVATFGFEEAGIKTKLACDVSAPMADAFKHVHEDTEMIVGNIMSQSVIRKICLSVEMVGLLFAGFPCQPYSRGGFQAGAADSRSSPLISILQIAIFRRIPVVLLECVPDAATNRFVRKILSSFCVACKYHMTETVLKQEQVWPCRRERWWVVLSAATIGPIPVKPLPILRFPERIRQILPRIRLDHDAREQLMGIGEEKQRFEKFHGELSTLELNKGGQCPTILHSMGSQMVGCKCGCRDNGFSDSVLMSKGVYGFLMRDEDDHDDPKGFRHPHPTEIAIMTACPIVAWPRDLRLTLAGLGQQATPVHALWMGSQIRCKVAELIFGHHQMIDPRKILDLYLEKILQQAKASVPELPMCPVPQELPEDDIPCNPGCTNHRNSDLAVRVHSMGLVDRRHVGGTESFSVFTHDSMIPAIIQLSSPNLTVGHLRAAEIGCLPTLGFFDVVDGVSNETLSNSSLLAGRCIVIQPIDTDECLSEPMHDSYPDPVDVEAMDGVEISPTLPFTTKMDLMQDFVHDDQMASGSGLAPETTTVGQDPLTLLKAAELVKLLPPVVPNLHVLQGFSSPTMAAQQRLAVLAVQKFLWADDEVRWHIQRILEKQNDATKILLDPLLASHVMTSGQTGILYRWMQTVPPTTKVIVSAVWTQGHWTPYAWTWNEQCLTAHSWDVQGTPINCNLLPIVNLLWKIFVEFVQSGGSHILCQAKCHRAIRVKQRSCTTRHAKSLWIFCNQPILWLDRGFGQVDLMVWFKRDCWIYSNNMVCRKLR